MPSPFPGMDPWLEGPFVWKGCHDTLVVKSMETLQPDLKKRGYYIDLGERVWIVEDERSIWPDNLLFRRVPVSAADGGTATAVVDEPVRIIRPNEDVREVFAEIRTAVTHELVTCIEFISHANKQQQQGRELYRLKQDELEQAQVHLVEIDLLRAGQHIISIPPLVVEQLKPWDYLVNLARRQGGDYEVYPIPLRQRLPRIRIPLKIGDEDAVLDLQDVLNRTYDVGPYPERLDYDRDPVPPLSNEDAQWANEILKSKGFRT